MRTGDRKPRVVVVGGGAAGLAAASRLVARAEVVLVEARDRLGGRIDTRQDPALGIALEHGAEFVHGRPGRTLALAALAGAAVRPIPDRHVLGGRAGSSDAARSFARAQELLALGTRDDEPFARVLARARREGRATATEAELADGFVRGFYLADPRTASSRALARFTRALDEIDGDVTGRVEGGYARVLDPLLRRLRRAGTELRLGTIVEEVRWRPGSVEVRARGPAGPVAVRADAAVVTLPVSLLAGDDVRFRPALREKRRAAAALTMGPIVKVLLRFRRPLWSDVGARALTFLHVPGGAVPVFWTLAPFRAPVLVGWAGGSNAESLTGRGDEEVVRATLRAAARGLGQPVRALEESLAGALVVDWTRDPFARGGYAVFPVGSAWAVPALAEPVAHTLFFAGEAVAGGLAGTVEGALRSGEGAAADLITSVDARR